MTFKLSQVVVFKHMVLVFLGLFADDNRFRCVGERRYDIRVRKHVRSKLLYEKGAQSLKGDRVMSVYHKCIFTPTASVLTNQF